MRVVFGVQLVASSLASGRRSTPKLSRNWPERKPRQVSRTNTWRKPPLRALPGDFACSEGWPGVRARNATKRPEALTEGKMLSAYEMDVARFLPHPPGLEAHLE